MKYYTFCLYEPKDNNPFEAIDPFICLNADTEQEAIQHLKELVGKNAKYFKLQDILELKQKEPSL